LLTAGAVVVVAYAGDASGVAVAAFGLIVGVGCAYVELILSSGTVGLAYAGCCPFVVVVHTD